MTTNQALKELISNARANPAKAQGAVLDSLEQGLDGQVGVVDPTNPFIFLMESAVAGACAHMDETHALTRKLYPSLAATQEDLYLHMSDTDYIGRFASPARTSFNLLFGKAELYQKAVSTGIENNRKLTIPKHTEFSVADLRFTMQYPIEMRIMSHGGLQVVYDGEEVSPLVTLESNLVDWTVTELNGTEFVMLSIPVQQFEVTPNYGQLNISTGFNETFNFENNFYYARAYVETSPGEWEEVRTTHTEQVYDSSEMTVVLKVLDNALNVRVPQIYFTNGLAVGNLRVDIYTTRGEMDQYLGDYDIAQFNALWRDLDRADTSPYSAPLESFQSLAVWSQDSVQGGTGELTFEQLRRRVMRNATGNVNLPITGAQLTAAGEDLGYDIVKSVDNVTERIFKATRRFPEPTASGTVAPAAARMATLQEKMSDLAQSNAVMDNGERITIMPNTLYEFIEGSVSPVDDSRVAQLESADRETRANAVNQNRYLYTPFYYVLDSTENSFDLRAYHLDTPAVSSKRFVRENDTTQLEVATGNYALQRIEGGYRLWVRTQSGDALKALPDDQVHAQLSFVPAREAARAYVNGVLYGKNEDGERTYRFDLSTNFDIDNEDTITLDGFKMFDLSDRELGAKLTDSFDLVWFVSDYQANGLVSSDIDEILGRVLLDEGDYYGVVQEQFDLNFGTALEGLWRRSRSVAGSLGYETHLTDEPAYHENNVYERDPQTGYIKIERDSETGEISYRVLHHAGDPVTDPEGNPVYKHRAGEIKRDAEGKPIVRNNRETVRQFDVFLIDAVWRYATETQSVAYINNLVNSVVGWVTNDIGALNERLLERTELFYYPKTTYGDIPVYVDDGRESLTSSEQSFHVRYYMTRDRFDRLELREPLTNIAVESIGRALRATTVSLSEVNATIKAAAGEDVLSVETTGLAGEANHNTVTLRQQDTSLILKKRLEVLSNGDIAARDAVTVEFIRHTQ